MSSPVCYMTCTVNIDSQKPNDHCYRHFMFLKRCVFERLPLYEGTVCGFGCTRNRRSQLEAQNLFHGLSFQYSSR